MPSTVSTTAPQVDRRKEFSRRLRHLLADRNMSQSDLAEAAKIGRNGVSTYVTGKMFPKPATLQKIADTLGVDILELAPGGGVAEPTWELRNVPDQPGQAWLTVNRSLSMDTAIAIVALLQEEDGRGQP